MAVKFSTMEAVDNHIPLILKLDVAGQPVKWIHWQDAVILHFTDKVVWTLGEEKITLHGGYNSLGEQSTFDLSPIIACNDQTLARRRNRAPLLTNKELFRRDQNMCMYCGGEFKSYKLTRDHVVPTSKGGKNVWENTVAACKPCNHRKADRTPESANMPLLAVPYVPSNAEFLILQNRRILADQMEFLKKMVPESSRAHKWLPS